MSDIELPTVVILAAGRGSRMKHLTDSQQKTMLKINEKPLIDITFDRFYNEGFRDFVFVVGYRKEDIISYFDAKILTLPLVNEQSLPNIKYIEQQNIKGGTATTYKGIEDPMLQGLTRITQQYQTKSGRGGSFSQYFVFRKVSEKTDPGKFIHPGFAGVHVFVELQKYVEDNMRRIVMGIL